MSLQPRIWTSEDAQQLTTLRDAAGLDVSILAKRHSLSVHQVRQLEEGGDDRFYSQAIKLQVGRKLLRALGGDLVELPQVEDVAELASDVKTSPVPEPLHASAAVRDATQSTNLQRSRGRWWLPLAGVSLVALAWFGWQQSVTGAVDQKKNTKSIAAVTETQPAAIPAATVDEPSEPDIRLDDTPTASDGVGALAATTPSPECRFGSEPKRVSVFEPRRPGNYVYFEAQEPVSICVRDAAQQITTLELTAGRGRTVRGAAPFEVLSQQFGAVRIFYQGKMVAPGVLTEPHIVLRPQAIVEPATEVN
jgi:hypothetical protein